MSHPSRARTLLRWYDAQRRDLPWRAAPGAKTDPYRVWLSEVMLQQTTVATVIPFFERFLARWPTVTDLAAAPLEDVLAAWAGLGYYARARNLHACAKAVAARGGAFPETEDGLRDLPGLGPYTAAAIAAIAFGKPAVVVDGNVERVMARLHGITFPLPGARTLIRAAAARLTPKDRPGDYAQAVMDLGATICTPRAPACGRCPWRRGCVARMQGLAETLPRKAPKPEKPTRHGVVFWLEDPEGRVLMRRRPANGLLGGMLEFPGTEWTDVPPDAGTIAEAAPALADWTILPTPVRHTFSHFHLELRVAVARLDAARGSNAGIWLDDAARKTGALPSVMRKVETAARAARAGGAKNRRDRYGP